MTLSSLVRVVIVEDQPVIRNDILSLTQKQPGFIVVGSCGSVHDALILIPSTNPDLLLLDITLTDGNGFDILQKLSPVTFKVIFLTADNKYAIKAIKYGALDYLLKPIDEDEFKSALDKVLQSYPVKQEQVTIAQQQLENNTPHDRLVLRSQQYLQIVSFAEIIYCQSDSGYTTFHLADGRQVLTSKYIKEYEELLPANIFLRPHQSYVVNSRYIDRYHKDGYLILKDSTQIPVSSRRKDAVIEYLTGIH